MRLLAEQGRLAAVFDLHGHSRLHDAFFYGCDPAAAPTAGRRRRAGPGGPADRVGGGRGSARVVAAEAAAAPCAGAVAASVGPWPEATAAATPAAAATVAATAAATTMQPPCPRQVDVRLLPWLAARLPGGAFSYGRCSWRTPAARAGAARVVAAAALGVRLSYTLEVSLGGCLASGAHFGVGQYLGLGEGLCRALEGATGAAAVELAAARAAAEAAGGQLGGRAAGEGGGGGVEQEDDLTD